MKMQNFSLIISKAILGWVLLFFCFALYAQTWSEKPTKGSFFAIADETFSSISSLINNTDIQPKPAAILNFDNKSSDNELVNNIQNDNTIKGVIYADMNGNCKIDNNELPAGAGLKVKVEPGNYITTTDAEGKYELKVPTGNYTVSLIMPDDSLNYFYRVNCPANNQAPLIFSSSNETTTLDFYLYRNLVADNCTDAPLANVYGQWQDFSIPTIYNNNNTAGNQANLVPNCLSTFKYNFLYLKKDAWLKFTAPSGYSQMLIQVDNSNNISPYHYIGLTVNKDCELSMIACANDVLVGIESVTVSVVPNQTYWIRILDLTDYYTDTNVKGKIRLTPTRPLALGTELVVDGDFANWKAVNLNPANLAQTLPQYARFASHNLYVPDRTNIPNEFLPRIPENETRLLTGSAELTLEGSFSIGKNARTLKSDFFSFGAGYTGYGGRLGSGTPLANYCNDTRLSNSDACEGFGTIQGGQALPTPIADDANFMLVNGAYNPSIVNAQPFKVWCQTLTVEPGQYYYLSAQVNNLISAGRNIDAPLLRFTICATKTLPGTTLIQDTLTIHNPPFTNNNQNSVIPTLYGAGMFCGTKNADLTVIPSTLYLKEAPDDWRLMNAVYKVPEGITQINYCIENLSLTKNGNDFALDKISCRKIEMPIEAFLDNIICSFSEVEKAPNFEVNLVKGRVYEDKDLNCAFNQGDSMVVGGLIKAEPGPYYTTTDKNGNYTLRLPKGEYTIRHIANKNNFNEAIWEYHCLENDVYSLNITGTNEEIKAKDFALSRKACAKLKVDITSNLRLRCFESITTITYKNEGNVTAENAYIEVTLPEYVTARRSSKPWQSYKNQKIVYQLGNLAPNTGGKIFITDYTACTTFNNTGIEQCTEVRIFPVNNCNPPNPNWNKANLITRGECLPAPTSVTRLTIKNDGIGNMTDSTAYRLYANNEFILQNKLKLKAGDSLVLELPAQGQSIRLEADQVAYHPLNQQVSVGIEGCSANNDNIARRFINQLPQNDDADEFEVECLPIIGSYDPNDKLVSPIGLTENHYVKPGTPLEYTIRFQNTGNAPAFNIYVIDTLSQNLDLETLELMSTSHPAELSISNSSKPTLRWDFRNINLPDSTNNEPESHGFIKFKISPKAGIAEGTIVENFADIYFDFNPPIRTNTTITNFSNYQIPVSTTVNQCNVIGYAPKKPSIVPVEQDTLKSNEIGEKYEWFLNGTVLNLNKRSIKAIQSGNYEVKVTKNGCVSEKSTVFAYTITALNEFERLSKIQIFPNPSQGRLFISIENPLDKEVTLTLINATGVIQWEKIYPTNPQVEWKKELNFSRLGKGLFFLLLQNSKGSFVKKVVIE
jgi:uncharacterized repeat protein (TIGR01451 family)